MNRLYKLLDKCAELFCISFQFLPLRVQICNIFLGDRFQQYAKVQDSLANITRAIEKGIFTDDLRQRAEQLENEKTKLETRLHELKLLEPIADRKSVV